MTVGRGRDQGAPPHGGFARSLTVADYRVAKVPSGLSDEDAALVEPAAIAFHGVARAELPPTASVVVLGAGPIGLLVLQVARAIGAGTTVVVDPVRRRRDAALVLGADAAVAALEDGGLVLDELTRGAGADVVLECAGTEEALQQAVDVIAPGGRIVLLGDPLTATVAPRLWLAKEVTIVASAGYSRSDIEAVMGLMAAEKVRTAPIHTRTISLDAIGQCLQGFVDATTQDIKVLVDPRQRATEEESL
jgi:2-desacetyl-2-hydroxyethyl bacteriochlorophyllide A dehydrogenase